MKIGYACINTELTTKSNSTFRLKNYSKENFIQTVKNNLIGLADILAYNKKMGFNFFRISSDLIPFASHPVCDVAWQVIFKEKIEIIGQFILKNKFRISMHPSQFVLINAKDNLIIENSIKELIWHCELLDLMGLKDDAKVQIHVGGIYGDKEKAIERFICNYQLLPQFIRKRLVIENDDRLFNVKDCLSIHAETGIPIIFDNFHHECLNEGESMLEAIQSASKTWKTADGMLMTDYSSQALGMRRGKHATSIDDLLFKKYLQETTGLDFDIMLEIKDKQVSGLKALKIAKDLLQLS